MPEILAKDWYSESPQQEQRVLTFVLRQEKFGLPYMSFATIHQKEQGHFEIKFSGNVVVVKIQSKTRLKFLEKAESLDVELAAFWEGFSNHTLRSVSHMPEQGVKISVFDFDEDGNPRPIFDEANLGGSAASSGTKGRPVESEEAGQSVESLLGSGKPASGARSPEPETDPDDPMAALENFEPPDSAVR